MNASIVNALGGRAGALTSPPARWVPTAEPMPIHPHGLGHRRLHASRPAVCQVGKTTGTSTAINSRNWRAQSSRDDTTASIDEPGLRKEIQKLEVLEPEMEQSAESAALPVAAAVVFGAGIWAVLGHAKAEEYFAGYLLEQSLSVDNLFVFILVFEYFKTPIDYQKKVLTYGIATAAVLRLVLIVLGADIVESWKPVLLIFAAILLFSSFKLLLVNGDEDEDEDLSNNAIVRFSRSLFTFTDAYDGDKFFTTLADGTRAATPLLLVLLVVEFSDVVFAVDSIPAVFGVTLDPFIVYTSNIFAILSLRGLFTFVATFMSKMRFLDKSVALVLGFVGVKILAEFGGVDVPTDFALEVVGAILALGVGASLLFPGEPKDDD